MVLFVFASSKIFRPMRIRLWNRLHHRPSQDKYPFQIGRKIPVSVIIELVDHEHKEKQNNTCQIKKMKKKGRGKYGRYRQQYHAYNIRQGLLHDPVVNLLKK